MSKCVEKILKYNPGEKSLKAPFAIYLDFECLLKCLLICLLKNNLSKTIPKNHIHRKKLFMILLVEQCLQDFHLMKKKINLVIAEEKIVLKNCVKSQKRVQ